MSALLIANKVRNIHFSFGIFTDVIGLFDSLSLSFSQLAVIIVAELKRNHLLKIHF